MEEYRAGSQCEEHHRMVLKLNVTFDEFQEETRYMQVVVTMQFGSQSGCPTNQKGKEHQG